MCEASRASEASLVRNAIIVREWVMVAEEEVSGGGGVEYEAEAVVEEEEVAVI